MMTRPPKCFLVNIATGETMTCLFNPAEVREAIQVNWNRQPVLGLSHQVLQYQSTSNRQLPGVEFILDHFFAAEQPGHPDILSFRAFLRALTVPLPNTHSVIDTAPPRVLFIWPKVITIETVLTQLEFQYQQFAVDGSVLMYTAICTFEEILDTRIFSETYRSEE